MDKLSFPFFHVVDGRGRSTGWIALRGPLRSAEEAAQFERLRRDHRILGLCSYLDFPARTDRNDTRAYGELTEGWCHCFRAPERVLPAAAPRLLLSNSDFTDPERVRPRDGDKRWDFVYVCPNDGAWREKTKNWELARRCLPLLCDELGLKGLLVGREGAKDVPAHPNLECTPFLRYGDFLDAVGRARFLFVPNELDASPRILAEALCLDVPVLVNEQILGGWKYVNDETGAFFSGEHDLVQGARACLERPHAPRAWFDAHHGPRHAGRRLRAFLETLDPGLRDGADDVATFSPTCKPARVRGGSRWDPADCVVVSQFDAGYFRWGELLARSLALTNPHLPVHVDTVNLSAAQVATLVAAHPLLTVENHARALPQGGGARAAFMANRKLDVFRDVMTRRAEDRFLFVDADLLVRGRLDEVFDLLDERPVAAVLREHWPEEHLKVASGLLAARRDGRALLDAWKSIGEEYERIGKIEKGQWYWDQATLRYALKTGRLPVGAVDYDTFLDRKFHGWTSIWSANLPDKNAAFAAFSAEFERMAERLRPAA